LCCELRLERRAFQKRSFWTWIVLAFLIGLLIGAIFGVTMGLQISSYGAGAIELTMIYGSEKQSWIEEVTPLFLDWWKNTYPNRRLVIHPTPMGSRESLTQIISGSIKPVIWSPASSIWIPLANWYWQQEYGVGQILIRNYTSLVHSPIVLVTWEKYAEKYNITGFQSLYDLSRSPEGGTLLYAHTDPQRSNSGFMATVLEIAVAAGVSTEDLKYDDLTRDEVKGWLSEIESRVVLYGESTGFLMAQMVDAGPSGLNVVAVYENLVLEKNLGGEPQARWGQRLIAVYPEEGTLSSDHPFCVLNAPWVSEEQRWASEVFLRFLLSGDIQAKAIKQGFRPESTIVELDPSIFNEAYGIMYEIPCRMLKPPTDSEVLWHITDLWLVCRAGI